MNAIGQPISRIDGRLKVSGAARYTADIPIAGVVYGVIVQSTIANGRTVSIDTAVAERASGVVAVFTHRNMPRMNPRRSPGATSIRTGNPIFLCRTTGFSTPTNRSLWLSLPHMTRQLMPEH